MSFNQDVEEARKVIEEKGINIGTPIRINELSGEGDEYVGRVGIVESIDGACQLHGTWGSLAIIPNEDDFDVISIEEHNRVKDIYDSCDNAMKNKKEYQTHLTKFDKVNDAVKKTVKYGFDNQNVFNGFKDLVKKTGFTMNRVGSQEFEIVGDAEKEAEWKMLDDYMVDKANQNNWNAGYIEDGLDENPLDQLERQPIFTLKGNVYGVEYENGYLYAGGITNSGILREYQTRYDNDLSLDENIEVLYENVLRGETDEKTINDTYIDTDIDTDLSFDKINYKGYILNGVFGYYTYKIVNDETVPAFELSDISSIIAPNKQMLDEEDTYEFERANREDIEKFIVENIIK